MIPRKISLRKRIALRLFRKFRHTQSQIHPLNYLFWECTLRCNLSCLHCGSDCKKDAVLRDMPLPDFLNALDQLEGTIDPHKTMIVLTGGEVLLRTDLPEIGRSLYERGFPWGMVTNGMLLTEARLNELLDCGLRAVTVSLDGLEDSHNWLRNNPNSFARVVSAISLLPRIPNLKYDVVTCVTRKNLDELPLLRDLLISLGVAEWRIFTITPIGRAKGEDLLHLPPRQFRELMEFIKETRASGKIGLNYGCEGFLGAYEGEVRDNLFFCRAGITIASVLADGSISACPNLRGNFVQGNIYRDNLAEVWDKRFLPHRDRSWTKTGICAQCEQYDFCEGNGLHLHNEQTGEILFCHLHHLERS